MKTYEEVLAGNSFTEIMAMVNANTNTLDAKFAEIKKREGKAATDDEMTEIDTLTTQTETLQIKAGKIQKVTDAEAKNTQRRKDLNEPDYKVPFSNGNGDPAKSDGKIAFPFVEAVKNFKGASNVEAASKALGFYKFVTSVRESANGQNMGGPAVKWCQEHGIDIKTVQEAVPQDGGVLVPIEFERTLIDLREQYGSFRPNVKTIPMTSETKMVNRRTGGLTAYFVGEAAAGTASTPAWDQVQLIAKKLMCLAPYTTEIAEDAMINIGDTLAGEIAYAFARKEDDCGFLGDGTSTYGGIRGVIKALLPGVSATIASVAGIRVQGTISTGTFASATLGDFQATIGKLPKYADTPNAKWYMHKTFFHTVAGTLADAAGGNTTNDVARGPNTKNFLGYPVEFAQVLPFTWVADTVFALFGDLALAAKMGDRRQTTLFIDPYSQSANDMIQIRGTERFDIVVHDVGDTTTPGPIVAFASAAS